MTAALRKAFTKASDLPRQAQEELARQLLEDIAGELKWDETLANSQEMLEHMAQRALESKRQRKTIRKGFDEL
jgi:hypothetical protein